MKTKAGVVAAEFPSLGSKSSNSITSAVIKGTSYMVEKTIGIPNSYGRVKLLPGLVESEHQKIIDDFLGHFKEKWYRQESSVDIHSWIDDTVYFIGSPISVLKPYIRNGTIPPEGICINQDCIRTKNTKVLFDDSILPAWGSCFSGLVTIAPFSEKTKLLQDSLSFLLWTLKIPIENLAIQINSKDQDLLDLLESCTVRLIKNEKPDQYYTHKYGMGDTVGRNFNFVLREKGTEKFNDIGNFIIIEDSHGKRWVELALGTTVIMKELFELDHILDTSVISSVFPSESQLARKFQDCVVSSILLSRLGLEPNASNTKGRILRSYIRWIVFFAHKFGVLDTELRDRMERYQSLKFIDTIDAVEHIMQHITSIRKQLLSKHGWFSKEEEYIYAAMHHPN